MRPRYLERDRIPPLPDRIAHAVDDVLGAGFLRMLLQDAGDPGSPTSRTPGLPEAISGRRCSRESASIRQACPMPTCGDHRSRTAYSLTIASMAGAAMTLAQRKKLAPSSRQRAEVTWTRSTPRGFSSAWMAGSIGADFLRGPARGKRRGATERRGGPLRRVPQAHAVGLRRNLSSSVLDALPAFVHSGSPVSGRSGRHSGAQSASLARTESASHAMQSTHSLLLRYLLPVGVAREPHGDVFLQHAIFVSNIEALRRWLPHYVKVHAVLAAVFLGLSALLCARGASSWIAVPAAVLAALEVCSTIVFSAATIALRIV
jgi:hypothetical protein